MISGSWAVPGRGTGTDRYLGVADAEDNVQEVSVYGEREKVNFWHMAVPLEHNINSSP